LADKFLKHYSVLNQECVEYLLENFQETVGESVYADLTFGAGGHSLALICEQKNTKIIACDQDPDAYSNGLAILKSNNLEEKIHLMNINFIELPNYLKENNIMLNGIVADLGVSSHQFDKGERGFSFRTDAPLDMRMNYHDDSISTAADIVNNYSKDELEKIFYNYGEERFTKRIVEKIIEERDKEELKTTKQLEDIIFHCYPKKMRYGKTNPSTRVFQALRIEVNQELKVLADVIPQLLNFLKPTGRMVIISFHSLEDRIVKRAFKTMAINGSFKLITKKPQLPSEKEINENSRSRSAKLRVIERV